MSGSRCLIDTVRLRTSLYVCSGDLYYYKDSTEKNNMYYARRDGWDELSTQPIIKQHCGQPAHIKSTSIGQHRDLINYDIHRDLKSLCKISYA